MVYSKLDLSHIRLTTKSVFPDHIINSKLSYALGKRLCIETKYLLHGGREQLDHRLSQDIKPVQSLKIFRNAKTHRENALLELQPPLKMGTCCSVPINCSFTLAAPFSPRDSISLDLPERIQLSLYNCNSFFISSLLLTATRSLAATLTFGTFIIAQDWGRTYNRAWCLTNINTSLLLQGRTVSA